MEREIDGISSLFVPYRRPEIVPIPNFGGFPFIDDVDSLDFGQPHIFTGFEKILAGQFMVEFSDEGYAFFACNFTVADFVGGVRRSATDPEFTEGEKVVQSIQLVIKRCVFGISTFRPLRVRRKSGFLRAVIEVPLTKTL